MSKETRSVEINLDGSGFQKLECIIEVKEDEFSAITKLLGERELIRFRLKTSQKRRRQRATLIRRIGATILGVLSKIFSSIAAGLLLKSWWK